MIRGFMLDSARCLEKPDYYYRFFEFAARRGIDTILWHFTDDQGCSLRFECLPDTAFPHALSKANMQKLIAHARSLGIDLIPEVASLGHCMYITQLPEYADLNEGNAIFSGICPVAPQSRQILKQLIEETCEIFDSANIHVGLDEANIGRHPLTRAAMAARGRGGVFADHICYLHGIVSALGRRMWMWGDSLLNDSSIAGQIPHDIVMCNWQYAPDAPEGHTQYFLDECFDVVLCSALISHDQTLFPGERFALPNIRNLKRQELLTGRGHVLGSMNTIWTPVRFMADSLWIGIDLAATIMRESKPINTAKQIQTFCCDYYGFNPDLDWIKACAEIYTQMPLRKEWIDLCKFGAAAGVTSAELIASAQQWHTIVIALQSSRHAVRMHGKQYETFMLMAELVAHVYAVAVSLQQDDGNIDRYIISGRRLLARLEAIWDQERHSDDPRKKNASIAHFQDDHLIPLFAANIAMISRAAQRIAV